MKRTRAQIIKVANQLVTQNSDLITYRVGKGILPGKFFCEVKHPHYLLKPDGSRGNQLAHYCAGNSIEEAKARMLGVLETKLEHLHECNILGFIKLYEVLGPTPWIKK